MMYSDTLMGLMFNILKLHYETHLFCGLHKKIQIEMYITDNAMKKLLKQV